MEKLFCAYLSNGTCLQSQSLEWLYKALRRDQRRESNLKALLLMTWKDAPTMFYMDENGLPEKVNPVRSITDFLGVLHRIYGASPCLLDVQSLISGDLYARTDCAARRCYIPYEVSKTAHSAIYDLQYKLPMYTDLYDINDSKFRFHLSALATFQDHVFILGAYSYMDIQMDMDASFFQRVVDAYYNG